MVAFFVASLVDYRWIRWGALPMYLAGIAFLILARFIGTRVYGARSWINIGPINFQPAQLAVIAGIMVLAMLLSQFRNLHPALRLLLCGIICGAPMLLILLQPDLGRGDHLDSGHPGDAFRGRNAEALPDLHHPARRGFHPADGKFRVARTISENGSRRSWIPSWIRSIRVRDQPGIERGRLGRLGRTGIQIGEQPDRNRVAAADGGAERLHFSGNREPMGFPGRRDADERVRAAAYDRLVVAYRAADDMGVLVMRGVCALDFHPRIPEHRNDDRRCCRSPAYRLPLISYSGSFVLMVMFALGLVNSVWVHRKALA